MSVWGSASGGQSIDPLELGLRAAVVSCLTSVLGPELLFSNRAVSPLDC